MSNDSIFIKALGVKYKELSSYKVTLPDGIVSETSPDCISPIDWDELY